MRIGGGHLRAMGRALGALKLEMKSSLAHWWSAALFVAAALLTALLIYVLLMKIMGRSPIPLD